MVKQVGLLSAGCQPWNTDVCAASGDRFAYSATLAIYVYELDRRYNQFKLLSILSEHKKTISAIAWHPRNHNIIASSSFENRIIVWDLNQQKPIASFQNTKATPVTIGWCLLHGDAVSYIYDKGPLFLWDYAGQNASMAAIKETSGFSSEVTCFRWHPKATEKVALGHKDGSVSFCVVGSKGHKHAIIPEIDEDEEDDPNEVVALEWDPLSLDYLLMSNTTTGIRLVDSVSHGVIMQFQLPTSAAKVKTLSWVHSAPGMFLTGDSLSGLLRVWNVSKSTPVESIRVKNTGFHALQVIGDTHRHNHSSDKSISSQSSTSIAQNPSAVTSTYFALPPAQLVCTFLDGGVGLYDLSRRAWDFLRDEGHIETIFDCKFSPHNCNILATGSFDGTVKLWDINSFNCKHTSPGNEGIIYTISWAPSDLNCIVAGTSKSGIFIWDIDKGRVIKRFGEHGKHSVFTVAWNTKDSRRIMSCGADGYCIIRQVNGELVQKYKHPAPVYGCDWSLHNKDMLATGCEDKMVRVYYTATATDKPLKVFSGHTAKVFHVKWSPLKENLLCSGSDDHTIRIWDYSQEACISTMSGHLGPIRGLLWNTEIPYLIVSGSWDATIKVWDGRDATCLDTVQDHGADVYGLACHPSRPFIVASSSRDSTVRLLSLTTLIQPLEMNILAGKPWTQILSTPDVAMTTGAAPLLTGRVSRELKLQAEEYPTDGRNRVLKFFSKFFMAPAGTDNLWELVSIVKGLDDTLLSQDYSKGIMHVKHLVKFYSSDAQQLEMAKVTKFGGGIGVKSRESKLRDAASLHIRTGNIQRYCELMVELGEWTQAIAVAPGVSMEYWKSLATRYSKFLINENKDLAVPYCTAVGDSDLLTDFYISRGQISDAVVTAQVACEGLLPSNHSTHVPGTTHCNGVDQTLDKNIKLLHTAIEELSNWHLSNGSPVLSACCYLAIDDTQKAMSRLIQGHEVELAVSMGMVLGNLQDYTSVAIEMLSRRCERLNKWELAIDLLHLVPNNQLLLAKCCSRWAFTKDDRNLLYKKAHLPSVDECFTEAEKLKRRSNVFECVMYYLLSPSPEIGMELGLQHVIDQIKQGDWSVDTVFSMLQLLGSIRTDVLQVHRKKGELLAVSAYVGAFVAIRRGYDTIVHSLFQHTRSLLQKEGYIDIGVTESQIQSQCMAWTVVCNTQPRKPINPELIPADYKATYIQLIERAGQEAESSVWGAGLDCLVSSHLPSHSDIHLSCLTGERIQGLACFLEDGKTAISPNEALMWAKVNPFSPMATGYRLNPF